MGFSQNVPRINEIMGIAAYMVATNLSPKGDNRLPPLFGFETISRNAKQLTHTLPAKNKVPIEMVNTEGGTFGASKMIAEPITHRSENGNKINPNVNVTHLGSFSGSWYSDSICTPNSLLMRTAAS